MEDRPHQRGSSRLDAPEHVVRVVLAESSAPGPLHYLLEAEGFRVVGCASDEHELARLLAQDLRPDVVVLDVDISVTAVTVARQRAPEAQVIAIWPDGVLAPAGGGRVAPWLVYEQLGPSIRSIVRERRAQAALGAPVVVDDSAEVTARAGTESRGSARIVRRVSLTSVMLVVLAILTMGAAVALESWHVSNSVSLLPKSTQTGSSVPVAPSPAVPPASHGPTASAVPAATTCIAPAGGNRARSGQAHPPTDVRTRRQCHEHAGMATHTPPTHPSATEHAKPATSDHTKSPQAGAHSAHQPASQAGDHPAPHASRSGS
jgi:hypothetical protein